MVSGRAERRRTGNKDIEVTIRGDIYSFTAQKSPRTPALSSQGMYGISAFLNREDDRAVRVWSCG